MLCSRQKPLNASATADSLPDTHHEHPSRAAGSFLGHTQSPRRRDGVVTARWTGWDAAG